MKILTGFDFRKIYLQTNYFCVRIIRWSEAVGAVVFISGHVHVYQEINVQNYKNIVGKCLRIEKCHSFKWLWKQTEILTDTGETKPNVVTAYAFWGFILQNVWYGIKWSEIVDPVLKLFFQLRSKFNLLIVVISINALEVKQFTSLWTDLKKVNPKDPFPFLCNRG